MNTVSFNLGLGSISLGRVVFDFADNAITIERTGDPKVYPSVRVDIAQVTEIYSTRNGYGFVTAGTLYEQRVMGAKSGIADFAGYKATDKAAIEEALNEVIRISGAAGIVDRKAITSQVVPYTKGMAMNGITIVGSGYNTGDTAAQHVASGNSGASAVAPATAPAANTSSQFKINEDMSQKAQYAYQQKLGQYAAIQAGGKVSEEDEAKLFAQAIELQNLKAPASAVFCDMGEMTVVALDNNGYKVTGYVNSQNSYGAMLRTEFTLTVVKVDGTWKSADQFISSEAQAAREAAAIRSKARGLWWLWTILGIIFVVVDFFIMKACIGF